LISQKIAILLSANHTTLTSNLVNPSTDADLYEKVEPKNLNNDAQLYCKFLKQKNGAISKKHFLVQLINVQEMDLC
jgi:hypothetical protein